MTPLFNMILDHVPSPTGSEENHTQAQVFTLDYDNYVGRIGVTRIFNGSIKKNQEVLLAKADGEKVKGRVRKLIGFLGLEKIEIDEAGCGDICAIAGFDDIDVGDSLVDKDNPMPLDPLHIEEPTLSVVFSANDSPLAGLEGKHVTSNKLKDRLEKEMETNIAMTFETLEEGAFKVSGRGELQIAILAENMRREDFEFNISRPEVVIKEVGGVKMEPYEHLVIDVPEEYSGSVIEKLGKRKANMQGMTTMPDGTQRVEFEIPARGLIGFRSEFLTDSKGEGVMNHSFLEYRAFVGGVESRSKGALVSRENGDTIAYSLFNLQDRGVLFVGAQTKVYQGMVIGENARAGDLEVNPLKGKQLTNMRSAGNDDAVKLVPPQDMNLERALEWIEDDELVEVTPKNIRIRKKILDPNQRKRAQKKNK